VAVVTILALLALCGWLGAKLLSANKDVDTLRKQVERLKRQNLLLR